METGFIYRLAADMLLVLHVLVVAFIVLGFIAILVGGVLAWPWVRHPWFRLAHVVAIGVIALFAWAGVVCPLTTWEMALRAKAGGAVYQGAFIAHWLGTLLYYDAPAWVFVAVYSGFGAIVLASWFIIRPRRFGGD